MKSRIVATVRILVDTDDPSASSDILSSLLSENGTHAENSSILDWEYVGIKAVEIPDDYQCDDGMPH